MEVVVKLDLEIKIIHQDLVDLVSKMLQLKVSVVVLEVDQHLEINHSKAWVQCQLLPKTLKKILLQQVLKHQQALHPK